MGTRKHSFNFGMFKNIPSRFLRHCHNTGEPWGTLMFTGAVLSTMLISTVTIMSAFEYAVADSAEVKAAKIEFNKAVSDAKGGHTYFSITSDDSVTYSPTSDHQVSVFNFQAQIVMVDGRGNADRVFRFDEYKNYREINLALNSVCKVAKKMPSLMDKFSGTLGSDTTHSASNKRSETFSQKYCTDAYVSQFPQLKLEEK